MEIKRHKHLYSLIQEDILQPLKYYYMLDLPTKKHNVIFFSIQRYMFFSSIVSFKRKKKKPIHVHFAKAHLLALGVSRAFRLTALPKQWKWFHNKAIWHAKNCAVLRFHFASLIYQAIAYIASNDLWLYKDMELIQACEVSTHCDSVISEKGGNKGYLLHQMALLSHCSKKR